MWLEIFLENKTETRKELNVNSKLFLLYYQTYWEAKLLVF